MIADRNNDQPGGRSTFKNFSVEILERSNREFMKMVFPRQRWRMIQYPKKEMQLSLIILKLIWKPFLYVYLSPWSCNSWFNEVFYCVIIRHYMDDRILNLVVRHIWRMQKLTDDQR